ncbi:MAG: hypothetical protein KGJ37_01100, partial [Verrucomicrobiota bacterium]|nr:hypothetical protein [Verrucomicrobiota bacterium]
MKTLYLFLAAISGLVVCGALRADKAPAKPASRIDVVYVNPGKFTDIKPYYLSSTPDPEPGRYLRIIKEHLESIGPRFIPADQHLTLRITDV